MEEGPPASTGSPSPDKLIQRPRTHWIEPIADDCAIATDADPSERAIMRQSIRLAFVAALQHLAPKQRAVVLLMEVLGWSASEVAETLGTSVAAVNSALQRARVSLASRHEGAGELSARNSGCWLGMSPHLNATTLTSSSPLLQTDAKFCMPPYQLWFQGPRRFVRGCWEWVQAAGVRGWSPLQLAVRRRLRSTGSIQPAGTKLGPSLS